MARVAVKEHPLLIPNGVTPAQTVKEVPGKHLEVSHSNVFYLACQEELSLKRGIQSHLLEKHEQSKVRVMDK